MPSTVNGRKPRSAAHRPRRHGSETTSPFPAESPGGEAPAEPQTSGRFSAQQELRPPEPAEVILEPFLKGLFGIGAFPYIEQFAVDRFRDVCRGHSMKVRASVKRICEHCKVVRRRGRVYVICSNPRHKQRQG